jgi:hypothetical protein
MSIAVVCQTVSSGNSERYVSLPGHLHMWRHGLLPLNILMDVSVH